MKPITLSTVLTTIKEYIFMAAGMFVYSFGWLGCVVLAGGTGGGATGFSLVLCALFKNQFGIDIEIGTMSFIVNGILLIAGGFIVGWNFGIKTIYCIIMLSIALNFWAAVLPEGDFLHLDNTLSVILGGLLSGVGIAMCFMQGGSSGGTDIVAMIINNYRTVSYGKILIYSDCLIIGSTLLVGYQISTVIYGFVVTATVGYTVDMIMAGNNQSSQLMIVTRDYERMADMIVNRAHRGVTLIDSQGWYSKEESKMVMVVCRKRETNTIIRFIKEVDPNAFVTVGSVMGVYGKGFEGLNKV